MKKHIKEEYYGRLKNGAFGKLCIGDGFDNKKIEDIIKENKIIYGCSSTNFIFLEKLNYSENECEKVGYFRLVEITKVTTTVEKETVWVGQ